MASLRQKTTNGAAQLRRRAKEAIEVLATERLEVVLDFLGYLRDREESEATQELLRIPGFMKQFERACNEPSRATDWRKVRRDVYTDSQFERRADDELKSRFSPRNQ